MTDKEKVRALTKQLDQEKILRGKNEQRIAELEAEVSRYRGGEAQVLKLCDALKAEVERLKKKVTWWEDHFLAPPKGGERKERDE